MDLGLEIIANTTEFQLNTETAVAIGKFDGVHLGHRKLLQEILAQKQNGFKACVFTFDPTPAVLFGLSDGKELTTREEKRSLFAQMGVDILIEFPLSMETAAILPEEFVRDILVQRMRTKFVAAGSDLSFGNKGAGDAVLLQKLGQKYDFMVKTIEKISVEGIEVSSTYIRSLIEAGRMEQATVMLGMPYSIQGKVVHGNRIGRTLGFPTVNQLPKQGKLLPPNGVYCSEVKVGNRNYRAITNIGCKPTVTEERVVGAESYLYDFSEDIYEQEITVYLRRFKRPEMQFDSLEALRVQLAKDIAEGKNV